MTRRPTATNIREWRDAAPHSIPLRISAHQLHYRNKNKTAKR